MSATTKVLKNQLDYLLTVKKHPRAWHLPLMIALAVSLPVFMGVWSDNLAQGLLGSLGAMVILNLPPTGSLLSRWVNLLACSFTYVVSFTLGLLGHYQGWLTVPLFGAMGFIISLIMGYYRLLPPAGLFMLMAMAIGLFMPSTLLQVPALVGTVAIGSLFAVMIGGVYSLIILHHRPYKPAPQHGYSEGLLRRSGIMGLGLMVALAVALLLDMPRPYWVAMSCYVVIQSMNLQEMWVKQLHRVVGTLVGLVVALALLLILAWLNASIWVAVSIFCLMFLIETLVVRHYGSAVVFITPLTIFLAEYSGAEGVQASVNYAVMNARFWDTLLGCVIGFMMGWLCQQHHIEHVLIRFENRVMAYWQHTYGQMENIK